MTDEQIRIAISELRGWRVDNSRGHTVLLDPAGNELWFYSSSGASFGPCRSWEECLRKGSHYDKRIPDYCNDLNAIHKVVMGLDRQTLEYSNYCSHLNQIVAIENSKTNKPGIQSLDATARQRAEAFLRTFGKWEEPE